MRVGWLVRKKTKKKAEKETLFINHTYNTEEKDILTENPELKIEVKENVHYDYTFCPSCGRKLED